MLKNMRKFLFLLVAFVVVLLPASATTAAPQSTITVNSLADDLTVNGNCTLREALQAAELNLAQDGCAAGSPTGSDLIVFAVNGAINMALGEYTIYSPVTIQGNGRTQTIIDAGGDSRIFNLVPTEPPQTVRLESMTLQNGRSSSGGAIQLVTGYLPTLILELDDVIIQDSRANWGGALSLGWTSSARIKNSLLQRNTAFQAGGAISTSGSLFIEDSVIQNNQVISVDANPLGGGGIFSDYAQVSITRTQIQGNRAVNSEYGGGGVYCKDCILTLTNSTIRDNLADLSGNGGGVAGDAYSSWVIEGSTISGNSAEQGSGGGIYFSDAYGELLLITNSTISGNTALLGGGLALDFTDVDGSVSIRYTTIADNNALALLVGGGAIFINPNSVPVAISRSIIDGNVGFPACYPIGETISGGYNLLQHNSCGAHPLDQVGVYPLLGTLADNGGPTFTHALLPNSPAIDAALCLAAISTDQRGAARPQGAGCDSGAFEYGGALPAMYLPLALGSP